MDPVGDARALVSERFPAAVAAFLGVGILSPRRTSTSDLDVVVVLDRSQADVVQRGGLAPPYRESLIWRGWPAEIFVHLPGGIGAWFAKDAADRAPVLPRMCTDGEILLDADGTAVAVRSQALAVLAAGPPPAGADELAARRYALTDLLDDLAGSADPGETAVICWSILTRTAQLALVLAGSWLGGGKWLLRELRATDPELAADLLAAREDPARLADVADRVLDRAGGRLWAGYRQSGQDPASPAIAVRRESS